MPLLNIGDTTSTRSILTRIELTLDAGRIRDPVGSNGSGVGMNMLPHTQPHEPNSDLG